MTHPSQYAQKSFASDCARERALSPEQRQAINLIQKGLSHEDEEARINSRRWLYVQGPPRSGKSADVFDEC